jgi:hypothetical protein
VPSTDDYNANGLALINAINQKYAQDNGYASVVFQLGPGFYTLPQSLTLYPGYSLLGAGMNATVVQILCPSCDIQGTVVVGTHDSQGISLDQTIANLTITGNQNPPLFGYINDTLTLDHVYLSSGFDNGRLAPLSAAEHNTLHILSAASQLHVTDSLLGPTAFVQPTGVVTDFPAVMLNSEVDPRFIAPSGQAVRQSALCSGVYSNTTGQFLSPSCQ